MIKANVKKEINPRGKKLIGKGMGLRAFQDLALVGKNRNEH